MVNQRFNALAKDRDWRKLVVLWGKDKWLGDVEMVRKRRSSQADGGEREN